MERKMQAFRWFCETEEEREGEREREREGGKKGERREREETQGEENERGVKKRQGGEGRKPPARAPGTCILPVFPLGTGLLHLVTGTQQR